MVSQRDRDEFDRIIKGYSEETTKIRDLSTDEDMERYRKQLTKIDRSNRTWTVGWSVVMTILISFLGVLDVITDQILHASISAVVVGILIVNTRLIYKLPQGNFSTVHLLSASALIVESVRLFLRESWWSLAAMLVSAAFILYAYRQSKKLNKRK